MPKQVKKNSTEVAETTAPTTTAAAVEAKVAKPKAAKKAEKEAGWFECSESYYLKNKCLNAFLARSDTVQNQHSG